jgi:hypothetical protein
MRNDVNDLHLLVWSNSDDQYKVWWQLTACATHVCTGPSLDAKAISVSSAKISKREVTNYNALYFRSYVIILTDILNLN